MSQTEKMLSRKEGKVGYLTFNNPERHNAVSLEMWEAASGFLEDFKNDKNIRVVVVTGIPEGVHLLVAQHAVAREHSLGRIIGRHDRIGFA